MVSVEIQVVWNENICRLNSAGQNGARPARLFCLCMEWWFVEYKAMILELWKQSFGKWVSNNNNNKFPLKKHNYSVYLLGEETSAGSVRIQNGNHLENQSIGKEEKFF